MQNPHSSGYFFLYDFDTIITMHSSSFKIVFIIIMCILICFCGNILETSATSKFVYEDKNAVTLDHVNAYLHSLNIPTNPPNSIHYIRASAETGRGLRMKISIVSGKTINKHFKWPYEIVDFVDGDDFFPWLRSKSDVFISFEDKKQLQSESGNIIILVLFIKLQC